MFRRNFLALAAAGLAAPSVLRAQGAAWPDRPIRLIVPWPPGGGTDIVARIFTPKLSEVLGKQVVIENRGGASGSVGATEASRAAPDGYTWMLALDSEATNQTTMRLPYRVMQAFSPLSLVAMGPLVFGHAQELALEQPPGRGRRRQAGAGHDQLRDPRRRHPGPRLDHAAAAARRLQADPRALPRRRPRPAGRARRRTQLLTSPPWSPTRRSGPAR